MRRFICPAFCIITADFINIDAGTRVHARKHLLGRRYCATPASATLSVSLPIHPRSPITLALIDNADLSRRSPRVQFTTAIAARWTSPAPCR